MKAKELNEIMLAMGKEEREKNHFVWDAEKETARDRAAAAKVDLEILEFRKQAAEAERDKMRYERDLMKARFNASL
jgi:hypothetical protein